MPEKKKIAVKFIMTDKGEFLYDEHTMKIYSCNYPHYLLGKIEKNFVVSLLKT